MKTVGRWRIVYKQEIENCNKENSDKNALLERGAGFCTSKSPAVSFYFCIFIYIAGENLRTLSTIENL
jgi:hypothetical protein